MPNKKESSRPEAISKDTISLHIKWVMLIYFCSGACSLIDEVVWVRLIKLTLGNTVYASSIVVSTFMGGLALGALIMSRVADRIKRPLRLYAILEVCATFSALSLPWILQLADGAYRWIYTNYQFSPKELMIVQTIVSGPAGTLHNNPAGKGWGTGRPFVCLEYTWRSHRMFYGRIRYASGLWCHAHALYCRRA